MKFSIVCTGLIFSVCASSSVAEPQSLTLRQPSIIILVDAPAEIKRNRKSDENYDEATGDFAFYAGRMVAALRKNKKVKVQWSSARAITFAGTGFKPVARAKVGGGWGYVFYAPGSEPVVIEGVATDDHLVCEAVKLFKITAEGYACGT